MTGSFKGSFTGSFTLGIKIAQKPDIVWSLGPKALIYESLVFLGLKVLKKDRFL